MSFSSELKSELCKIKPVGCCAAAEMYGIFLFSKKFTENTVFFSCDNSNVADRCQALISEVYGFEPKLCKKDGCSELSTDYIGVGRIFADFLSVEYITDVFSCEKCFPAFLRGAFLSAGTVTDPQKSFHAEIKTVNEGSAISVDSILKAQGFNSHLSKRGENHLVYFKGSEAIADFLTLIGGTKKALEIIDEAVIRDLRNKVNRGKNCETANITKTVNAAVRQNTAIKKLRDSGRLSMLPEQLRNAAEIRFNNPEMSLSELARLCSVSRSGLNHRLNKLVEIAEEETKGK